MMAEVIQSLLEKAEEARKKSYSPYSRYPVGAALMAKDGTIYAGCNVENVSYGAALCAERNALGSAVADGQRDFTAIAIIGSHEDYTMPCGICRQVMQEFAPDLTVICLNGKGEAKTFALKELLPYGFDNRWLPEEK